MSRCLPVAIGVNLESPLLPVDGEDLTIHDLTVSIGLVVVLVGVVDILRVDLVPKHSIDCTEWSEIVG